MFQQSGMGLWTTFRPAEFRNMTAVLVYYKGNNDGDDDDKRDTF